MIWPRPLPAGAWADIGGVLRPAELALFRRFSLSDQWHSYRVMVTLRESGRDNPDLLVAALLHDIGKTKMALHWWERVIVVLGGVLWPGRSKIWGLGQAKGWRRAFVIKANHPAWGAAMAAAVGCSPLTVELIAGHQTPIAKDDPGRVATLLRYLQAADDES